MVPEYYILLFERELNRLDPIGGAVRVEIMGLLGLAGRRMSLGAGVESLQSHSTSCSFSL